MKSNYNIALEVLSGKWGNGNERKQRLTEAGYDYNAVQSIVNSLVKDGYVPAIGEETKPDSVEPDILEIDFDPDKYKGIQVNILI